MWIVRNLLMAVTAIGMALITAVIVPLIDKLLYVRRGYVEPPFWGPLLGAVVAGCFVILIFRRWQPDKRSSDSPKRDS